MKRIYKKLIIICIFLFSGVFLQAQSQVALDKAIFQIVEKMPEYPGGIKAFEKYVQDRMGIDTQAVNPHFHKKVFVEFVIDKSGQVQDARILQGISKEIDKEVLLAVEQSPRWIPGRQRGVPVYVKTSARVYVE